jgi:hypothetical protein
LSVRRGISRIAAIGVVASAWSGAGLARADDRCPTDARGKVVLHADVDPLVGQEIGDHLRRSLSHRGIAVCSDADASAVVLEIAPSSDGFAISVRIDDPLVHKAASRDLDVTTIPSDARALAIAQAADELLRVTWPERFSDEPPHPPPAPPAPPSATPSRRESASPTVRLGIGIGGELFSSGHAQLGPDLDVTVAPISWLALGLRGGARTSSSRAATFGEHDTSALVASAGAAIRVALGRAAALELGPRVTVMRFAFTASPREGYVPGDDDAVAVCVNGESRAVVVPIHPLHVGIALSVGAPIRAAHATVDGERVHEMNGLLVTSGVFAGVAF